jgi:hypothetical protein
MANLGDAAAAPKRSPLQRLLAVDELVHRFLETDHMRGIHFSRHGL